MQKAQATRSRRSADFGSTKKLLDDVRSHLMTMQKQDRAEVDGHGLVPGGALVLHGRAIHQLIGRPLQTEADGARGQVALVEGEVTGLGQGAVLGEDLHVVLACRRGSGLSGI